MSEESAREIYMKIWTQFAVDRKENRATAYVNLQRAFSEHAAELVPAYLTAKEHMTLISDIEQWTKSDKQSESGDPMSLVSDWLNGGVELSRIPLESMRKN
jgi:hypothetical protein